MICLFNAACTTTSGNRPAPAQAEIEVSIPESRMILPEAPGKGRLQLGLDNSKLSTIKVTDTRLLPGQQQATEHGHEDQIQATAIYGFSEQLAGSVSTDLNNVKLGARFQVLGESYDKAAQGNTSLSFGLHYLLSRDKDDNGRDSDDCFLLIFCDEPEGATLETQHSTQGVDLDILIGHRFSTHTLFYVGGFYQDLHHQNKITYLDRDASGIVTAQTVNRGRASIYRHGPMVGFNIQFHENLSFLLEYLEITTAWDSDQIQTQQGSYNGAIRIHF